MTLPVAKILGALPGWREASVKRREPIDVDGCLFAVACVCLVILAVVAAIWILRRA